MKPGWKTTEFWFTMVLTVGGLVLLGMEKIDTTALATLVGLASGGYSVSRGLAKKDVVQ